MQRIITQYKHIIKPGINSLQPYYKRKAAERSNITPLNTKVLAFCIFLIFFFESGTIGILPQSLIFIYRNVRVSDIILYSVIIYSLFCYNEYKELLSSKSFVIVKLLFAYIAFQFIISVLTYKVNAIEYFFRMKYLWMSLMVFPYMLLLKRNGIMILVKLILPFSILSNVLYIITAVSGVAMIPDIKIVQQSLPGGFKVWRVYGGTFFGELFMLGIIFYWNEYRFRLIQIPLVVLFGLPHLLSFGRGTWVFLTFSITFIIIWSSYRKKDLKATIKQAVLIVMAISVFMFAFYRFLPDPEDLSDSIEARIEQGKEDYKYGEGTIGSRLANQKALFSFWSTNPVFGIGMHPFWVIKPVTTQEAIYAWGFHDLKWVSVLVAYGIIGLLIAIIFQLYYLFSTFKLLKKIRHIDVNYFFMVMFLLMMLRDSVINYKFNLITVSVNAVGSVISLYIANFVYLYEKHSFHSQKSIHFKKNNKFNNSL